MGQEQSQSSSGHYASSSSSPPPSSSRPLPSSSMADIYESKLSSKYNPNKSNIDKEKQRQNNWEKYKSLGGEEQSTESNANTVNVTVGSNTPLALSRSNSNNTSSAPSPTPTPAPSTSSTFTAPTSTKPPPSTGPPPMPSTFPLPNESSQSALQRWHRSYHLGLSSQRVKSSGASAAKNSQWEEWKKLEETTANNPSASSSSSSFMISGEQLAMANFNPHNVTSTDEAERVRRMGGGSGYSFDVPPSVEEANYRTTSSSSSSSSPYILEDTSSYLPPSSSSSPSRSSSPDDSSSSSSLFALTKKVSLMSLKSIDLLVKIFENLIKSLDNVQWTEPERAKVRKVKCDNAKINEFIIQVDGGMDLLTTCGFEGEVIATAMESEDGTIEEKEDAYFVWNPNELWKIKAVRMAYQQLKEIQRKKSEMK